MFKPKLSAKAISKKEAPVKDSDVRRKALHKNMTGVGRSHFSGKLYNHNA